MPVDSRHPLYAHYLPQWTRCRHACEGEDSIKGASSPGLAVTGTRYLPQPTGMDARDYAAYKLRASWYGAAGRVRKGIVGLIQREAPVLAAPALMATHAADITGTGVSLDTCSTHVLTESFTTGHVGILLDLPDAAQAANQVQPRWTVYTAAQIINWWTLRGATGETLYGQVILEEEVDVPDPADPYQHTTVLQWRELALDDGVYCVRVWRRIEGPNGAGFVQSEPERRPTRRGQPLTFLPFVTEPTLQPPPLLDVVDVNFAHYRTSADYKHSLHMSALITAWITGWDNPQGEMKIGALTAWIIPPPEAKVGFLETAGRGFEAMRDDLQASEAQMAVLGARLLETQKRAVEAAETHAIRQSAELSIVESYAQATTALLTKAVRWHAWWAGMTENPLSPAITYTLNTDFLATTMDATLLGALVDAYQKGTLTQEDLYYNLNQGDLLEPGVTFAQWQSKLEQQSSLSLLATPLESVQQPPARGNGSAVARAPANG